jgi:tripartite-type tricarboxylate transporter receptor subunit TctC
MGLLSKLLAGPTLLLLPALASPQDFHKITTEAMADPTVKEKLAAQDATLVGNTPEHFRGFIDSEIRKWAR